MRTTGAWLISAVLAGFLGCGGEELGEELALEGAGHSDVAVRRSEMTSTKLADGPIDGVVKLDQRLYYATPRRLPYDDCNEEHLMRFDLSTRTESMSTFQCSSRFISLVTDGTNLWVAAVMPSVSQVNLLWYSTSQSRWFELSTDLDVLTGLKALAVDDRFVFWAGEQGLWRMPKSGGTPVRMRSGSFTDVAADGTYVFVASTEGVFRIARTGTAAVNLLPSGANRLALHGSDVYWLKSGGIRVGRVAKAGGPSTTLYSSLTTFREGGNLVVDGRYVFWVDFSNAPFSSGNGSGVLRRLPIAGGQAQSLLTQLSGPYSLIEGTSSRLPTANGILYLGDAAQLRSVPKVELVSTQN